MNHCGEKFHSEVAKFRFLNELIKVLSPKVSAWTWPAYYVAPVPHLQTLSPCRQEAGQQNLPTCREQGPFVQKLAPC